MFRCNRTLLLAVLALAPAAALAPSAVAQHSASAQARAPLSPRDTTEFAVNGAPRIRVDYGRPFMRGRQIMGGLVPWGRVWRTGANAATVFSTEVPLRIGNATVPAGSYSLFTLPSERGEWLLILNGQTGQWGTQYDASRDVVRIPMRVQRLANPVEQFTIRLDRGRGDAGTLALEWENTRASVPFRVAGQTR